MSVSSHSLSGVVEGWDVFTVYTITCNMYSRVSSFVCLLLLLWRWVKSAAKKDGVDEEVSKYDGEKDVCLSALLLYSWHTLYFSLGFTSQS